MGFYSVSRMFKVTKHDVGLINEKLIVHLLFLMFFIASSATDIFITSLPQMAIDFNSNASQINLILSVYNFGITLGVLFFGEVSNRFGRRPVIIFGLFLFAVSALLIAIIKILWVVVLLRFIQSLGFAIILVVSRLILKDIMDKNAQIQSNGKLLLGLTLSPAVAPIINR